MRCPRTNASGSSFDVGIDDGESLVVSQDLQHWLLAASNEGAKLPSPTRSRDEIKHGCRIVIKTLFAFGRMDLSAARLDSVAGTGLDAVPEEPPSEVTIPDHPDDNFRQWLHQLAASPDDELGSTAKMALDASGVLALPRPLNRHCDLPAGGLSDIANRGSPEKLLMTELAQDDLVMLTRITLGQALYMRRESPPDQSQFQRLVLLETGVRVWGQSRLLVTAIGLSAMACGDEHHVETLCFSVGDGELVPVDLNSRPGILDQLGQLSLDPHPGEGMDAFAEKMAECDTDCEPLLVVARDTILDPDFQHALSRLSGSVLVADVQPTGEFRLTRWTAAGQDILQTGKLEETLRKSIANPVIMTSQDLPLFVRTCPPPLRTSITHQKHDSFAYGKSVLSVTKDSRLLLWEQPIGPTDQPLGAIEIDSKLSSRDVWLWHGRRLGAAMKQESWVVLGDQVKHYQLVRIDGEQMRHDRVDLVGIDPSQPVLGFFTTVDDHLIVVQRRQLRRLNLETGEPVGNAMTNFSSEYRGGGFVQVKGHWGRMEYDAGELHFRPIDFPGITLQSRIGAVVPTAHRGPVALDLAKAELVYSTGQREALLGADSQGGHWSVCRVSQDKERVLLRHRHASETDIRLRPFRNVDEKLAIFCLKENQIKFCNTHDWWSMLEPANELVHAANGLQHRFSAMGMSEKGLCLMGRKQRWHLIAVEEFEYLTLRRFDAATRPTGVQSFGPEPLAKFGYQLRRCDLGDGRVAWLDTRGMLHLRDSAQTNEVTLVLGTGVLSGWFSDQTSWGDPFFTGLPSVQYDPNKKRASKEVQTWLKTFNR